MRLTGSRVYYRPSPPKMPPGLVELMEGLTKEVLKHNPTDIYGFCAGHVQQLLEKRDGPSPKKSLPLEEKIIRAQEKVRQRATKRNQEYNKEIISLQGNKVMNDDAKDDMTLHAPLSGSIHEPHSTYSINDGEETTSSQQKEVIQSTLRAPVHHEKALEDSSEVEIFLEPALDISSEDKNDDTEFNTETIKSNSVTPDIVAQEHNKDEDLSELGDTTKDNKIKSDVLCNILPDILDSDKRVENVEIEESHVNIAAGVATETSTAVELSKDKVSDELLLNSDNIENLHILNPVDSITTTSSEKMINDNQALQNTAIENNINSDSPHNADVSDSVKNDILEKEDTQITQDILTIPESNSTQEVDHSESKEESLLHDTENLTAYDTENLQKLHITNAIQNSCTIPNVNDNKNSSQTENNEEAQFPNNTDIRLSNITNNNFASCDGATKDQNDTEDKVMSETSNEHLETESSQPIKTADCDIPTGVDDADITTMVTDNLNDTATNMTVDNKDQAVNDENTELREITAEKDNLQDHLQQNIEDNLTTHATETDMGDNGNGETSADKGEITQNDNHDTSNMDLETAAITIQKVFRTFLFKSRGSTFEDTANDESNFLEDDKNKEECDFPIASALNIDRRAHGITRMDTVLQTVNEEKSLSLSDDSSTLSSAATIIQAHVRGFLVRNKLNSNKTVSINSLAASNSNEPSITSLETDNDQNKNKTILNIHIVPEGENYLSRDESLITSMDLSLDSPPSSINLHPLGYDKSERRKQLKREDAIQSISPPSNNSGKLSEDFDSVKELSLTDHDTVAEHLVDDNYPTKEELQNENDNIVGESSNPNISLTSVSKSKEELTENIKNVMDDSEKHLKEKRKSLTKMSSDEMDVVTPFLSNEHSPSSKLVHSGEFHDAVLPTRVSRSDTSVVSGE